MKPLTPCTPNPCSAHAICREQNGVGACICEEEYIGDPYSPNGCRPECILNSDCPSHLACLGNPGKCKDPCPGSCAPSATCQVIAHEATCSCDVGYTGDGYRYCSIQKEERKISYKFITHFTNHIKKIFHIFIIHLNSFPLSNCPNISKSMLTLTLWPLFDLS